MSDQTKQYRPLTGPEIIDYITTEIRTALERSGQLPLHRAFHEMTFVGGVKVSGWGTADAKVQFSGATNGGHPDDAEAVEIAVGIKAEAEPPSLVRERLLADRVYEVGAVAAVNELPDEAVSTLAQEQFDEAFERTVEQPILNEMKAEIGVTVQVDESQNEFTHSEFTSGIPCPNFGSGCDHVPFASKAAMISHRNNWCAVSGRRRR